MSAVFFSEKRNIDIFYLLCRKVMSLPLHNMGAGAGNQQEIAKGDSRYDEAFLGVVGENKRASGVARGPKGG